jgi:hypothetical protein
MKTAGQAFNTVLIIGHSEAIECAPDKQSWSPANHESDTRKIDGRQSFGCERPDECLADVRCRIG